MTAYLPRKIGQTATLDPKKSLVISFRPVNPGPIDMTSVALLRPVHPGPDPINDESPIERKMSLYRPGVAQPIATKIQAPPSNIATLSYNATLADLKAPGEWRFEVENLDDAPQKLHAEVAYPSEIPLNVTEIPLALVNEKLALLLSIAGIRLRVDSNDGWVDFSPEAKAAFGLPKVTFNAPRFEKTILVFQVKERVNDIRSAAVQLAIREASAQFPRGSVHAQITFEEQDKEVLGTFHADVRNLTLSADLGLSVAGDKLTYGQVGASFPIKIDITGLPDWLLDPIFGYSKIVRQAVEGKLTDLLDHGVPKADGSVVDLRATVTKSLNEKVLPALFGGPVKVYAVDARNGVLVLTTYK